MSLSLSSAEVSEPDLPVNNSAQSSNIKGNIMLHFLADYCAGKPFILFGSFAGHRVDNGDVRGRPATTTTMQSGITIMCDRPQLHLLYVTRAPNYRIGRGRGIAGISRLSSTNLMNFIPLFPPTVIFLYGWRYLSVETWLIDRAEAYLRDSALPTYHSFGTLLTVTVWLVYCLSSFAKPNHNLSLMGMKLLI